MSPLHEILKRYWGYDSFRPVQEEVMQSVLDSKDTLALMPTGGGKSLCYQVPAMYLPGLCLVVSPLIALMKDQVESLRKKGITAFAVFSGMSRKEVLNILTIATESNCKFLYVSPERLETALFQEYLPALPISLLAVDEAHCISQWGYDFRPPYLRIAALREELPDVPVLALTASATPAVQQDICDRLTVYPDPDHQWNIFRQSFSRPNLSYSVFEQTTKLNKIVDILQKVPGTAIVYCRSRRRTKEIAELLQLHQLSASYYHAGLDSEERNKRQEDWIQNKVRVMVCTNAFGMGIDKPDVRTVIHADVPESLENYYQEAGRAGRDGKKSYAVLLVQPGEKEELLQSAESRFPSLTTIREVYQAIANYLQLPPGNGQGEYFEFDLQDFLKKFRLDGQAAIHAIKALEQDGWLALNEQVFLSPQVQFTITKEYLYRFEADHPTLEPMIKTLLRAYEGIFDFPTFISEASLARMLRQPEEEAVKQLRQLHQAGVIEYVPRKEKPQLYWLRNRIRTEELVPDMDAMQSRKIRYMERTAQMIRYIDSTTCRAVVIGNYFGDKNIDACGICDICLQTKKQEGWNAADMERLLSAITVLLRQAPHSIQELADTLHIRKDKVLRTIRFMEDEGRIAISAEGKIALLI